MGSGGCGFGNGAGRAPLGVRVEEGLSASKTEIDSASAVG